MNAPPSAGVPGLLALMTRERWTEVVRIVATGVVALLFWRGLIPIQLLWAAVAVGLYPLVKTSLLDRLRERRVGTEIFVTVDLTVSTMRAHHDGGLQHGEFYDSDFGGGMYADGDEGPRLLSLDLYEDQRARSLAHEIHARPREPLIPVMTPARGDQQP